MMMQYLIHIHIFIFSLDIIHYWYIGTEEKNASAGELNIAKPDLPHSDPWIDTEIINLILVTFSGLPKC